LAVLAGSLGVGQRAAHPAPATIVGITLEVDGDATGIIHDTIAVIVDTIADFDAVIGRGARFLTAIVLDLVLIDESIQTMVDLAFALGAHGLGVGQQTFIAALATVIHVSVQGEGLIDLPVAVVVFTIAQLITSGGALIFAAIVGVLVEIKKTRGTAQIAARTQLANGHGAELDAAVVACPAVLGVGLQVEILVDGTITVVIDPIADLDALVAWCAAGAGLGRAEVRELGVA
jgi:hypothetical protein